MVDQWTDAEQTQLYFSAFRLSSNGMAFFSEEGLFLRVNPAFGKQIGYPEEALSGKPWEPVVHPDDRKQVRRMLEDVANGTVGSQPFEARLIRSDGTPVRCSVTAPVVPGPNGWPASLFVQILDSDAPSRFAAPAPGRKTTRERDETSSDSLYRTLVEQCADVVSKHDLSGRILYISPSCRVLLGYEPEELIGTNVYELFHPEDLTKIPGLTSPMETAPNLPLISYRIRTKNGGYVWFETSGRIAGDEHDSENGQTVICISRDISSRKQTEQQLMKTNELLQKISSIDALTGLANRRFFDERFAKEWRHAMRFSTPLSVILLDIDYFKRYNDTYGHHDGDACLQYVAEAMRRAAKRPGDMIARYGGEEFVIVLPVTDGRGALYVAERMRSEVELLRIPHRGSAVSSYVTASLGAATMIPVRDVSPRELIIRADKALYRAKQEGRNRAIAYDEE
ncbi:sensor domain-containing diguanylate cyclase [Paenibacillus ehimensis]|uniref:Diguanylate cyclase n=1 Tax=Paenibacillus ehimensis TaxID=79264 RepID=A0ABT8VBQ3_9BACL|nr:diguanylate cyclase [Paenibacillus ehimensis]MDO3678417.1 diguanylate cyclase [Paenibacillus ehimensis]MEC0211611.1 diguanylate cyclase [Paenibacillus ehimensis]